MSTTEEPAVTVDAARQRRWAEASILHNKAEVLSRLQLRLLDAEGRLAAEVEATPGLDLPDRSDFDSFHAWWLVVQPAVFAHMADMTAAANDLMGDAP